MSEIGADQNVEVIGSSGLSNLVRAEIDIQIVTAKRFPRSVVDFKREAEAMATLDEDTAATMFYVIPRGGKNIEGPSVRLAEIVGSAWGNLRYSAQILAIENKQIVAQGTCLDLEKNVAAQVEIRRRITDKNGKRFNDDMIGVTANAACSIALRQAIFKVVPFAYIKDIYGKAQEVSIGKGLTMEQRRSRAFDWFTKIGAKQEDVFKVIKKKGLEDVTVDDLITLQGIRTAVMDGDTTWEAILKEFERPSTEEKKSGLDGLTEKLQGEKGHAEQDPNAGKEEVKDKPNPEETKPTTDPEPPKQTIETEAQQADKLIAQIRQTDLETLESTNDSLQEMVKGFKKVKHRIAIINALNEHKEILKEAANEDNKT